MYISFGGIDIEREGGNIELFCFFLFFPVFGCHQNFYCVFLERNVIDTSELEWSLQLTPDR